MILNPTLSELKIENEKERSSILKFYLYIIWIVKLNLSLMPGVVITSLALNTFLNIQPLVESLFWGILLNALINKDIDSLTFYSIVYLSFKLIGFIAGAANGRIEGYASIAAPYKYKEVFSRIVAKISMSDLESSKIANQIFRLNESYSSLWSVTNKLLGFLTLFFSFFISLAVVINLNLLITILLVIIIIIRTYIYGKELKEDWRFLFKHTENRRIADGYIGTISRLESLKEALMMNKFEYFLNRYETFSKWFLEIFGKRRLSRFGLNTIFEIALFACYAYTFYLFTNQYIVGSISLGQLTFNIAAFASFTGIFKNMLGMYIAVGEAKEKATDAYDIYTYKVHESDHVGLRLSNDLDIKISDLTFSYPNSSENVLKNISIEIKKGEKIAIVGENGAGKTTLINLILGLYKPSSGTIYVGNKDLNDLEISSWYDQVGILSQNASGYDYMSVKENIVLGNRDKNKYDVAIHAVGIKEMIEKYKFKEKQILSPKYENGISPSGGQWQKIVIARTLFRNTPIIILDEPTSSLDPISEYNIFNSLFEDFKSKTVVIISHRFSTVKKADRIIVMDDGKIVEVGNHRQLMSIDGKYAKAFRLQADSFKD